MIGNVIACVILVVGATIAAFVLRRTRLAGSGILAGVIVGIVLGPTVLGRLAPTWWEDAFVGGRAEREVHETAQRRQGADIVAMEAAGADVEAFARTRVRHEAELATTQAALDAARWTHQVPSRAVLVTCVTCALLGVIALRERRRGPLPARTTAMSVGLWSALLPGGVAFITLRTWWSYEIDAALLAAAAVAMGPWVVAGDEREAADRAEVGGSRLVRGAGRVATFIAVIAALMAMGFEDASNAAWVFPLTALPAAWFLPRISAPGVARLLRLVVVPALAALATARVDLHLHATLWMLLAVLILSGDGRWLGGVVGALVLGGRRALRTMRLLVGTMACGVTQLSVVALGLVIGLIDEPLGLALIAGALVIDVSGPMRRGVRRELEATEELLAEVRADEGE